MVGRQVCCMLMPRKGKLSMVISFSLSDFVFMFEEVKSIRSETFSKKKLRRCPFGKQLTN